jgi:hypothetical protein
MVERSWVDDVPLEPGPAIPPGDILCGTVSGFVQAGSASGYIVPAGKARRPSGARHSSWRPQRMLTVRSHFPDIRGVSRNHAGSHF